MARRVAGILRLEWRSRPWLKVRTHSIEVAGNIGLAGLGVKAHGIYLGEGSANGSLTALSMHESGDLSASFSRAILIQTPGA
jgi:hypothetical protein